jgi:hypothetical protein
MKHPSNLCRSRRMLLPAVALCSLPTSVFAGGLCDNLTQAECKSIASRQVYALLGTNVIATVYGSTVLKQSVVSGVDGNLIGLDFRPSQSNPPDRNNPPGL